MLKRIFLGVSFVIFASSLFAQSAKLRKANKAMWELNYIYAIELYNQVLEKNDNSEAKINIAECYRKISDSENAEYWYGQVVRLSDAEPIHYLYYGQALQTNGKCDMAGEWFDKFSDAQPDDLRGKHLRESCPSEEELMTKNGDMFEIKHLDFNSNKDDFSPMYYKDGIVFSSERDKGAAVSRVHTWTGNSFLELYYVEAKAGESSPNAGCEDFTYGRPEKFSKEINTKYHDAATSFSHDGTMMFFTRNNYFKGKTGKSDDNQILLKIFFAKSVGDDKWGELESLPFNSDEYSCAHPTLSVDGSKLFFSSDMPGGFGGMDLYVSEYENGRWGPPLNLGADVNTEGNEIFPYYSNTNQLYFSSNGHTGLGGLDIYYMDVDENNGSMSSVENIGYPINTISDDFGIVLNESGSCGYFSSDRTGGAGRDDIYSFRKISSPVQVYVYDEITGEPIEGAVVRDCKDKAKTTNAEGKVTFDLKLSDCCSFVATKQDFEDNSKEGCAPDNFIDRTRVEIPMRKESLYDMEGIVFDVNTNLPIQNVLVTLTNDDTGDVKTFDTDGEGRYYFELDEASCYTLTASKDGFADVTKSGQCTKGLTEPTTIQTNLNMGKKVYAYDDPNNNDYSSDFPSNPNLPGEYDGNPDNINPDGSISGDMPTSGIYLKDGIYIDAPTGEPFNGEYQGVIYENGRPVSGNVGGFDVSPSVINTADGSIPFLLDIYYDFDQSYIRDEAVPDLERLLTLMENNTDYIIEISSHTDSRGSDRYNQHLSRKRADAVVEWLVKRGIAPERLVGKGYGERRHVNNCDDYVPCSETEHQFNRRTEFKILGCANCDDGSTNMTSSPKQNPKVDECLNCPF